jgi:DNA-binding NtrC family response regulator
MQAKTLDPEPVLINVLCKNACRMATFHRKKNEAPMKGIKVLLVDDEVDFTASLSRILTRRGFDVEISSDGLTALARIVQGNFEVVVLDVKMPGMNGIQVLAEIRRLSLPSRVILLTGHFSLPDEENAIISGAFAYLLKPYPVLKLVELIENAAGK